MYVVCNMRAVRFPNCHVIINEQKLKSFHLHSLPRVGISCCCQLFLTDFKERSFTIIILKLLLFLCCMFLFYEVGYFFSTTLTNIRPTRFRDKTYVTLAFAHGFARVPFRSHNLSPLSSKFNPQVTI